MALFIAGFLGVLVLLLVLRALLVPVQKANFITYWQVAAAQHLLPDTLKLVVLGDSISVGVGAYSAGKTLVGRAAAYIETQTGRPVRVENYARSGATADDLLDQQLPKADLAGADIILLEIGANDSRRRTPQQFERAMKEILTKMPPAKTIIADVPGVKNREKYQAILDRLLGNGQYIRADIAQAFSSPRYSYGVTAGDFFHPNNRGYAAWFGAFRPGIDQVLKKRGDYSD